MIYKSNLFLPFIIALTLEQQFNTSEPLELDPYEKQDNFRNLQQENFWCNTNCSGNGNCSEQGCECQRQEKYFVGWDCSITANFQ